MDMYDWHTNNTISFSYNNLISISHGSTVACVEVILHPGFLSRAGTRVIYPAMAVHVPGYRSRGRPLFIIPRVRPAFALNIAASTSHRQVSNR